MNDEERAAAARELNQLQDDRHRYFTLASQFMDHIDDMEAQAFLLKGLLSKDRDGLEYKAAEGIWRIGKLCQQMWNASRGLPPGA